MITTMSIATFRALWDFDRPKCLVRERHFAEFAL
jgi:hypothetical protein